MDVRYVCVCEDYVRQFAQALDAVGEARGEG